MTPSPDTSRQAAPSRPAPIVTATRQAVAAPLTREDPASGLRVDLGAASIAARATPVNDANIEVKPVDPLDPLKPVDLADARANQDLWERIRAGYAMPALDTELVADHERWYASRPEYVQRMTQRANRYLYHIVEEVERRGMPSELALLPFIESAFNPQAMSSARASGMWQFMPATGKDFALRQNLFRDDRRDVLASTRAALSYLQRLHRMFGDWHLALAAYNWGEGNVQRAIRRNAQQGLPTDYLSLTMPAETRHYVPKLYAVRNIVAQPERFSLTLTPIENHPYFLAVPIERDIDVTLAARLAGLSADEFRALNPSMNKPVILAAGTPQVLLPYDNANQFVHNLKGHKGQLATWTAWQVPRTMKMADAARHAGLSESELRDINRIPPRMLVKAGSTLLVPRAGHRVEDVSAEVADTAAIALAPDAPPLKRKVVRARANDSVRALARRHGVTPQQLAEWNKIRVNGRFDKGERVVLYVPSRDSSRAVAKSRKSSDTRVSQAKGSKRVVAKAAKRGEARAKVAAAQTKKARNGKVRVASAR
ncbi:transglycosylase SLT domain-containing protein [Aquabacterium fontiphilum]|nr:transglycosylase SLT domain-containing protein [Aquabacterium fontiphilum]